MIYRLKQARLLSGMTLREAAKKLYEQQGIDITFQYLGKIEKVGCKMDSTKLIKYAKFYNVTVDFLVPSKHRPKVEFGKIIFHKYNKNF